MPSIKLHLEHAELDAVERIAAQLGSPPEALLYAALNRLMLDTRNPDLAREVGDLWEAHHENLPLWSDSAGGPHGYEGKPDAEPAPSRLLSPSSDRA